MKFIINEVKKQIEDMKLNNETIDNLNKFFESLNDLLKGGHDTLIIVLNDTIGGGVYSNILNEDIVFYRFTIQFKKVLEEFILNFSDNLELFLDIVFLLEEFNLFKLTHELKTHLFREFFISGLFCYVPINKEDFLKEFPHIKFDIGVIYDIVFNDSLKNINEELTTTMRELYLMEDIDLKYLLID